jgi:hypothetical protein
VRLDLMRRQDLAHCSLGEFRQAGMARMSATETRTACRALSSLGFRHQERLRPRQRLCGSPNVNPRQFLAKVV